MKVILIGDVVGKPGRRALTASLKQLKATKFSAPAST